MKPTGATKDATLEQAQALTRDWNQKSRLEQVIIRHQIWSNSALPDDEYTASWYDVKLLIEQNERLQEALLIAREQIEFLEQALEEYHGSRQPNPALDVIDAALNHAEQGERKAK